jgi:hypothetical protein
LRTNLHLLVIAFAIAAAPLARADCRSDKNARADAVRIVFTCPDQNGKSVKVRIFDRMGKPSKYSFAEVAEHNSVNIDNPVLHPFSPRALRVSATGGEGCVATSVVTDENNKCIAQYEVKCVKPEYLLRVTPSTVPFVLTTFVQPGGAGGTVCTLELPRFDTGGTHNESEALDITFYGNDRKTALFKVRSDFTSVTFDKELQLRLIEETFKKEEKERGASSRNAELINERKKSRLSDTISVAIEPVK